MEDILELQVHSQVEAEVQYTCINILTPAVL